MTTSRLARLGALLTLVVSGLVVATASTPATADDRWCADVGSVPPCIVSLERDGVLQPRGAPYDVNRDTYSDPVDRAHHTGFTITGLTEADLGHEFTVLMRVHVNPRVVRGWGTEAQVVRSRDATSNLVEVTLRPVKRINSCNLPAPTYCPATAPPGAVQYDAQAEITDAFTYSSDPSVRRALRGFNLFTNVNLVWYPPSIGVRDGVAFMTQEMANSHAWPDSSVFHGDVEMHLPNSMLREFYGIPNPATMTPGSFSTTSGTGVTTSGPSASGTGWDVNVEQLTFSKRKITTRRGVITPTRPAIVTTKRVSAWKARLGYQLARPRGAKVTGYQAKCRNPAGHVVRASLKGDASPLVVTGLRKGRAYQCQVRATSKVGPGRWSAEAWVPRLP